ncbi:MAG: 5'-3' exonuclease H3TH domain-containing protein [Lentisphaeria bacterium]|jgi:DNA polymerase-1
MSERMILVDGYSQLYRAYHAIPALTAPDGRPTNAIYGMVRLLLKLDQECEGTYGAVLFDLGRPAHRLELLPAYKANRPAMPEPLRAQLAELDQWLAALGWPVLREEGTEADDLIAALVRERAGHETAILTQDKDLAQLVAGGEVYLLQAGGGRRFERLGPAEVEAKFGIRPDQLRDYLALVGDSSDNIPGVPGIGAKTAAALLKQFGSAAALLEQAAAVGKPALRQTLAAHQETIRRNQALVALKPVLPTGWRGLAGIVRQEPGWGRLMELAKGAGFSSLLPVFEAGRRAADQGELSL